MSVKKVIASLVLGYVMLALYYRAREAAGLLNGVLVSNGGVLAASADVSLLARPGREGPRSRPRAGSGRGHLDAGPRQAGLG